MKDIFIFIFTPERIVRALLSFNIRWVLHLIYRRIFPYPIFGFKNTVKNLIYILYLLIYYTIKFFIHFLFFYYTYFPLYLLINHINRLVSFNWIVGLDLNIKKFCYVSLFWVLSDQQYDASLGINNRIFPLYADYNGCLSAYNYNYYRERYKKLGDLTFYKLFTPHRVHNP